MPTDTDNNFLVTGASANAMVATDYSDTEGSHFQVTKIAYGNTLDFNRVTEADGLPVRVMNTPQVDVTNISNPVSVYGSVGVYGINGSTAIAVTASNFGIRSLTAGNNESGISHIGADFVRVVGVSGAFPVGVSASNFGIRALTAGNNISGVSHIGADFVRVVGASGAYPIGITASELDIRGLTHTKDTVNVYNTVNVQNGTNGAASAFSITITDGFQTRVLRASSGADATTSEGALKAAVTTVEDTVRVVGLSGAYPVSVIPVGLTGITNYGSRTPFRVDDTGALYVALAAGTIGVTANITGTAFTLVGISLDNAGSSAGVVQIQGYSGTGYIPVGVTATDLDIRNLSSATDSVYAQIRVLGGSCGDSVDMGGTAGLVMTKFNSALNEDANKVAYLRTDDAQSALILTEITTANTGIRALATKVETGLNSDYRITGAGNNAQGETSFTNNSKALRVVVANVVQPDGITSGNLNATGSATQMGSHVLKSGIHFKSDLANTNKTIFIGSTPQNQVGYPLYNGDQVFIETDNTNKIYYSSSAGATLYFIGT